MIFNNHREVKMEIKDEFFVVFLFILTIKNTCRRVRLDMHNKNCIYTFSIRKTNNQLKI